MKVPNVTIRPLTSPDDPAFYDAMEIYAETFPRDERMPIREFAEMLTASANGTADSSTRHHIYIAERGSRVVGMRHFSYYKKAALGFFVYIAVVPDERNKGTGRLLIETAKVQCQLDALSCGGKLDAILFECERPELADGAAREFREQRLAYFQKLGAQIVSKTYVQPALIDGYEPVPLYLLAYPQQEEIDWYKVAKSYCRVCLGLKPKSESEIETLSGVR